VRRLKSSVATVSIVVFVATVSVVVFDTASLVASSNYCFT